MLSALPLRKPEVCWLGRSVGYGYSAIHRLLGVAWAKIVSINSKTKKITTMGKDTPGTLKTPFAVTNIIRIIQIGSYLANKAKAGNRKWI